MQRIFALILAVLMLLPLCACSSSLSAPEPGATEEKVPAKNDKKTEEEEEGEGPIVYPEGFAVGYGIGDITTTPIPMYNATAESVHDPLNLTCICSRLPPPLPARWTKLPTTSGA